MTDNIKVYISADIEGVNGVVYPHQTDKSGGDSYIQARNQQVNELNCIIYALLSEGVQKITVNDAHGSMENILLSNIDHRVELITGKPKAISMMHGLDPSYSCIFMTGYHAMAGSVKGVLSHTFSQIFNTVKLNGKCIGETELNSTYAGILNVPVVFVSGDDLTCNEAKELLGNVVTVETKKASSTNCAICKPNEELFAELKEAAASSLKSIESRSPYKSSYPFYFEIDFKERKNADLAEFLPFIERKSATMVSFEFNEYEKAYKVLQYFAATLS